MPVMFINGSLPAVDFETITVSNTAIGGTASKLVTANTLNATGNDNPYIDVKRMDEALITVETNQIRFRLDGTNPTASVGHLLGAGDSIVVSGYGNLSKLRFIRVSADATIQVTYYRKG